MEKNKVLQGYQAPVYQESDAVKNAQQQLQQQIANKPGDYQSQWQGQLEQAEEAKRKRQYDQNYALSASNSSGSSGGGGGGSGYGYDTHGMSTSEIKALQRELGITADGIWGPKTEAAYQAKYGIDIEAEYLAMKKAGATYRETDDYLLAAIDAGLISKDEANYIRHKRY